MMLLGSGARGLSGKWLAKLAPRWAPRPAAGRKPIHERSVTPMVTSNERNYLRAWREHRRMTQAQLAEMVDTTGAVISLLESGQRGLSDKWLRKLAVALGTRPGHLLEVDPNEVSSDVLDIWAEIPDEDKEKARDVLRAFRRRPPPPVEPAQPRLIKLDTVRKPRGDGSKKAEESKSGRGGKTPEGI
jgi:transcriptional regulator with XRE-family HTH domain